ncbi:hypothetical protein N9937_01180 [bacterium]|nr:hypothetical protein [bacterium]
MKMFILLILVMLVSFGVMAHDLWTYNMVTFNNDGKVYQIILRENNRLDVYIDTVASFQTDNFCALKE